MSKQPTSYLLFVYGTFGKNEDEVQLYVEMMGEQFFDIVSDGYLPYVLGPYHAIYKFDSIFDFEDIKERVDDCWQHMCHTYFLMEKTNNMSYKMGGGDPGFFGMKVEDVTHIEMTNLDIPDAKTLIDQFLSDVIEESPVDFYKLLLEIQGESENLDMMTDVDPNIKKLKQKHKNKVITIDEVLDKITNYGINSINPEEKQILDNYANRQ
jgi:hypothetical protein